jgi:hypothetical protein
MLVDIPNPRFFLFENPVVEVIVLCNFLFPLRAGAR